MGESGAIDTYARKIADLFARDFGLAVATLIERYVRRVDDTVRYQLDRDDAPTSIPVVVAPAQPIPLPVTG
ncbi:MAG TPA: hypothetical protein VF337_02340 [Candidatus Limnocylindrales bacterium]